MGTSYTDQLAKWVKEKKSTPRNKNLVAFLAVRADIKEALDAGYPVKTVWENMHELKRIEFGYDTFLNYVNRQIRRPQANQPTPQVEPESSQTSKDNKSKLPDDHTKKTTKPGTLSGFTFNPVPNAEELF
ncbi:TPA: TraK family protein [Legionella pneumophila]|uniref:TraK n=1 Tax=Legionella quateirensis TaxID=45072 RepID=A0A378PEN2_9GAMM|nr:TraK family protein [Legionella quateirensis]KTD44130.1 TraK [Legionella quateirensis]STY82973.1 traK [Legionella quateirensis]